ncbi:MAG: paraquat-inducible protein A [Phycisphaeraceae bacterium]|nr:paraquat-inducible protein A [Phycisphaeraceae bacterium]
MNSTNAKPKSLFARHPRRYDVPALLLLSAVTLIVGYMLPLMSISKLVFWQDDYTLLTSVTGLWNSGNYILAIIIFVFSIVFPITKLTALAIVWFKRFDDETRNRVVFLVGVLGKWSMLDVFVCALLIVMTKAKSFLDAEPRSGLFVFAVAIALSMVASILVEHLAKKQAIGSRE